MSEFDPYYFYLGIPPKEQPPDYYRLLGIERLEADLSIIEMAADRQMSHLRHYESGDHVDEIAKLLSEVSRARLCLLNLEQKAVYDQTLSSPIRVNSSPTASATPEVVHPASEDFDPYHKWLGIPPREQPPNYYRLLRLTLFEPDLEVIENAFEKEMADLKTHVSGQYVEFVVELSRELVTARDCLIDADKKAEYDAALRERLGAEDEGDDLADELDKRIAIDRAVRQATAEIIAKRNQLQAQAKQAALREQQALLTVQQLKRKWEMASRAVNTPTARPAQPRSVAQSQFLARSRFVAQPTVPVRRNGSWVVPVVIGGAAAAFALLLVVLVVIGSSNDRPEQSSENRAAVVSNDKDIGPAVERTPLKKPTLRSPTNVAPKVEPNVPRPAVIKPRPVNTVTVGTQAGQVNDGNGLKMQFCWCPPGNFVMGGPSTALERRGDGDPVEVVLTHGFWLAKYEVTQQQWIQVMRTTPWREESDVQEGPTYPATYVTWHDAMKFCQRLTEQEQFAGRLETGWHYTLPSDAQWEYACRAGSTTSYSFGDDKSRLGEFAWFDEIAYNVQQRYAHQVGVKQSNAWGLHDMHGNVFEWCRDAFADKLPGGTNPEIAPVGSHRVCRGGSWLNSSRYCQSKYRNPNIPGSRSGAIGFRVALCPFY